MILDNYIRVFGEILLVFRGNNLGVNRFNVSFRVSERIIILGVVENGYFEVCEDFIELVYSMVIIYLYVIVFKWFNIYKFFFYKSIIYI